MDDQERLFSDQIKYATAAGYDADTFCYAAKEHNEFSTGDTLLITYACNSRQLGKMIANMDIYVPKVVELPIPH